MQFDAEYEWDPRKAGINLAKHGVAFEDVVSFEWDDALIIEDTRRDYGEPRYLAYGLIGNRLHAFVFTPRNGRIRVISLRKANSRELRIWQRSRR